MFVLGKKDDDLDVFVYSISNINGIYKIHFFIRYTVDLKEYNGLFQMNRKIDFVDYPIFKKCIGKWKKARFDYVGNIKYLY